jgi:hypothetical protein
MLVRRDKLKRAYLDITGDMLDTFNRFLHDDSCLMSKRELAAMETQFMSPCDGFDECLYPRATEETIEADGPYFLSYSSDFSWCCSAVIISICLWG